MAFHWRWRAALSRKNLLLLLLFASLTFTPSIALGDDGAADIVIEVDIRGNQFLSKAATLSYVKTREGQSYDESLVRADEQRLLKTGRFESVLATKTQTPEGVIVTFVVVERQVISKVVFVGNKNISETELFNVLPFGVSDPLSKFSVEAGKQAILEKYKIAGYNFAIITINEIALERQNQVIYEIVEGPKVSVTKIIFKGNESFGKLRLRSQVGSSARFWPLLPGILDVEQVDRDANLIKNFYIQEGFLDAEVDRLLDFSADKAKVTITFIIEEGQRYRVNRVIFRGNTVFADDELLGKMALIQGEYYTALKMRRDVTAVQAAYGEIGYIQADIIAKKRYLSPDTPTPVWAQALEDGKPALLNLVIDITEADQYRIGQISIRGNSVTQERVIRRQLRFFPEQLYNTSAVEESRQRLTETRLFDKVTVDPLETQDHVRNILVQVSEARTAEFLVGVGVTTNNGVLGNVSFTQRNFNILGWPESFSQFIHGQAFKGAGQTLRITAEPGVELMRFNIEWTEPAMFDQPYKLSVNSFVFTRGRETYDETRYGGVISFGHQFKNRWYGEVATRIEGVTIDNLDSAPPEVVLDKGDHVMLGLKGTLVRDRTDSRWMPSTGDRFRVSFEQLVGDFNFGRLYTNYKIFRTVFIDALDRKHIIAGRATLGHIFGSAPVFEEFYGGGTGSIRGFSYRGISPRSLGTEDEIGGDFLFFAGTEYSFPIFGDKLRGVVFIDTGTVEESFEVTTYRIATGAGLRWIIPMFGPVPMSLDFGIPVVKDGDDDTQLINFSFGWTF